MQQQAGIAIGIDFGEITTALGSILGAGVGIASNKRLGKAMSRIKDSAEREFGEFADKDDSIAHVYEYGLEGRLNGRLWRMSWQQRQGDLVGNIVFDTARRPTQVGAGIDERLAANAKAAGRTLAQHLFPDKAEHLETRETLVSVAGVQRYTTRIGGDVTNPKTLVVMGSDGATKFPTRIERENKFYNKFQDLFNAYWAAQIESQGETRVSVAFVRTMPYVSAQINRRVRAASIMSRPRVPAGMSGLFVTDRGRPFTGYKVRQSDVTRIESRIGKRLEKELVSQWQR